MLGQFQFHILDHVLYLVLSCPVRQGGQVAVEFMGW